MNTAQRLTYLLAAVGLALMGVMAVATHTARATAPGTPGSLVPVGASYQTATLQRFVEQAIAYDSDDVIKLRVLFPSFATDPISITQQERAVNLADALVRVNNLTSACNTLIQPSQTCDVDLIDIQVRGDADTPALAGQIDGTVDGIFHLGGDQQVAMLVLANTLAEDNLALQHQAGMPFGGTSAGAAVQSRYMIAGYAEWAYAWHGLEVGAVDLWYGATAEMTRGLRFGLETAVIDQHILERGRIPRLLQATQQKPGQQVGLGVDWGTGVVVEGGQVVSQTAGWYAGVILDEETYQAAATAVYTGPRQILSIQNVAFHLLPAGPYGYDLNSRRPIVSGTTDLSAPDITSRTLALLSQPVTGTLLVAGDLATVPTGTVTSRFAALAQQAGGPVVVLAAGYVTDTAAAAAANLWAEYLAAVGLTNVQTTTLTASTNLTDLAALLHNAGSLFVTGDDQREMAVQVAALQSAGIDAILRQKWEAGGVLLFDKAAAAAVGSWMSDESVPADVEVAASDSFLVDWVRIDPGLGLIPGTVFEPRVMYDYLYGRLVSHVYAHPEVVTFGLSRGTALEINRTTSRVVGESAVMVIDGRYSRLLAPGTNGVMAATWLLLDTYAPGDRLPTQRPSGAELAIYLPLVRND